MTAKKWDGTDLQDLTADYLNDVLAKLEELDAKVEVPGAAVATVRFGILGTGARPHYLVNFRDTQTAYNSAKHKPDSRTEAYDKNNLSERSFTYAEIEQATNGRPKTEKRAIDLIYAFYKKVKPSPLNKLQKEHAVALVMKCVSVENAYRTAMESNK